MLAALGDGAALVLSTYSDLSNGYVNRAIGSAIGVNQATVRRDLAATDADASVATVQSLDGRQRPQLRHMTHLARHSPSSREPEPTRPPARCPTPARRWAPAGGTMKAPPPIAPTTDEG